LSEYATFASGTFIALTGYCAVRYSRHRDVLLHPTPIGIWRYFLDRFLAIYPAYAILTLLVFVGSYFYPAARHLDGPYTPWELLCNLLMVNQYLGMPYFTAMMWFVPFVLQLYLIVPLLCLLARKCSRLGIVLCSAASLVACLLVLAAAPDRVAEICKDWSPVFRLTPAYFGVAVALATSTSALPGLFLIWFVCAGARLALLPWAPGLLPVITRSFYTVVVFAALLGIAHPLAKALRRWGARLEGILTLLGQASFPFFLGHGVLIHFLWARFGNNLWIWGGYFVFSWAWSAAFIHCYLRIMNAIRGRVSRSLPSGAPAAMA
jgi:peptidoglycan/LPS O-acetylase OafA/YrhL